MIRKWHQRAVNQNLLLARSNGKVASKQRSEGETVKDQIIWNPVLLTGGNVHLCLLWKAMHRSLREGAGSSSTCIADTLNFHLFTLTEILFLTGFYQHFYCLRVSGKPRPSFEYILSLSPNQWSFSSLASWMLPLLAFHMYHDAVPLKMTNTVRFKTATHSA